MDSIFEQILKYLEQMENHSSTSRGKNWKQAERNSLSTLPYYFVYMNTYSSNSDLTDEGFTKSEGTLSLEKQISEKKFEMKKLAEQEKFEEAIVLQKEIAELKVQLEESLNMDKENHEKNKTAQETLTDLSIKLKEAVDNENYEEAAKLRDQIKAISK